MRRSVPVPRGQVRSAGLRTGRLLLAISAGTMATAAGVALVRRRVGKLRFERGLATAQLAVRGGLRYAGSAPRLFMAAGENRQQLRSDLAMQTADDITATLGTMKGVMVKLGQMASYVDEGLAPSVRRTLSRLQDSVPPMSAELAAGVIAEELGQPPEQLFERWDPEPIAAASIGQVHRAITRDGRAVAVKVQYPGIAEMMAADLDNVSLLRRMLRVTAPSQDVDGLIAELRERVLEELDYRKEAASQQTLHRYFEQHPTISVPAIVPELSSRRVVTSELVTGARFADILEWPQHERDLAGETLYRFVFRSLYEVRAFNGDPHPGNYIFHGDGKVTFLDFGMVKHFTETDLLPLMQMARNLCVESDPGRFRASLEEAGFLVPDAPLSDDQIADHLAVFYQLIRESRTVTVTGDYASSVVRRFFDVRSPVAQYARIPRSYVVLQRINLGLFALLGEMKATANWREIAEEIWPFMQAPPSTPMGTAELPWLASRPAIAPALA
jgi:predicted unusual protein kinase regulating ubiquinone biosynthesis (AarF/ABC1/UbiB family)